MSSKNSHTQTPPDRDDRLKKALKANLARRKAQARARAQDEAKSTGATPAGGKEARQDG